MHLNKSYCKFMIVFNEKHLVLEYDASLQTIIQTWRGFFSSEAFRAGVELTNKLFEERQPVVTFLVDISNSAVIKAEDTSWAAQYAIPRAMQCGLKYYGFVMPISFFTQVSLKNFTEELHQPLLELGFFKSLQEAKAWAKEKSST